MLAGVRPRGCTTHEGSTPGSSPTTQDAVKYSGTVWPWHASWLMAVLVNVTVAWPSTLSPAWISPSTGWVVTLAV